MKTDYYSDTASQFLKLNLLSDLREDVERGTPDFPGCAYVCELHKLPEGIFPYHWHEDLQLTIAVSKTLELKINGDTVFLSPGQGIFINSSVLHSVFTREAAPCERRDIIFRAELLYGSVRSAIYKKYVLPLLSGRTLPYVIFDRDDPFGSAALDCVETAFDAMKEQDFGFEAVVRERLTALCVMICRKFRDSITEPSSVLRTEELRARTMIDYIYKNYAKPLTVSQIASSAGISERECHRVFRQILSTTPIDFLRQHRISAAMLLLENSDEDITGIGERCGFQDPSYFSRTFHKITRSSPGEYRKRIRQNKTESYAQ